MLNLKCRSIFKYLKKFQNRHVSSLSPLGTAFNSKPQKSKVKYIPDQFAKSWKSYNENDLGLFQIQGLTRPEGFANLELECAQRCQELVEEACSSLSRRCVRIYFESSLKKKTPADFRFQKNICNFRLSLGLGHYLSPWSTMMEGNGYYLPPWSDHSGKVMDTLSIRVKQQVKLQTS